MHPDDPTAPRASRRRTRTATSLLRVVWVPGEPPLRARLELTGPTVIGRSPGDDGIAVLDALMSRRHATVEPQRDGTLRVIDSSSHGTWVDGARVTDGIAEDGSVIRCGDSFFVFRAEPADVEDADVEGLMGHAPSMRELRARIAEVAAGTQTVLVLGESGTGKELVARGVHALSGRRGPFVAVNCAAIPEQLAESTLFGHARGAFTGAESDRPGVFVQAEGGTLFLDEIGETSPAVQAKLLRAIETREITPVGASRAVACDVRLVAATLRDLRGAIERGAFRGDLYARIAGVTVQTPALAERREDILPILGVALGPRPPRLDPELVDALLHHAWPYNVRELLSLGAEMRARAAKHDTIELAMFEERLRGSVTPAQVEMRVDAQAAERRGEPTRDELAALYEAHSGNISQLARVLGYSRRHVRRFLEDAGLLSK